MSVDQTHTLDKMTALIEQLILRLNRDLFYFYFIFSVL